MLSGAQQRFCPVGTVTRRMHASSLYIDTHCVTLPNHMHRCSSCHTASRRCGLPLLLLPFYKLVYQRGPGLRFVKVTQILVICLHVQQLRSRAELAGPQETAGCDKGSPTSACAWAEHKRRAGCCASSNYAYVEAAHKARGAHHIGAVKHTEEHGR